MILAKQLIYRYLTQNEFKAINNLIQSAGGGSQTYIDLPKNQITDADLNSFFGPGTSVQYGYSWTVDVFSLSLGRRGQSVTVSARRDSSNCIRNQNGNGRIEILKSTVSGFPATTYDEANNPICLFILKDVTGAYWAGWFSKNDCQPGWYIPLELIPVLARKAGNCGFIDLSQPVTIDITDFRWPFRFSTYNTVLSLPSVQQQPLSIKHIIDAINSTGLIYDDTIIKRLCFSLLTKRFVILSGLAGSGKTQLALALAHSLCENLAEQMCFVPVGADWTNREPLLGYPNALKGDEYVRPENGVLDLLIRAQKPENQEKPFFLILDEMNLSVVERYFADFLSAMEAKNEPIRLWTKDKDGVPCSVHLGSNVFIIGTINVDETTYMFSPKVLDRANVLEFKISASEMNTFLQTNPDADISKADAKAAAYAEDFVAPHNPAPNPGINGTLNMFFGELKKANAEFGYRSAHEISRFIGIALANDDTATPFSMNQAVDAAIVQKLLPKLHGSKKKLTPVLKEMWSFCFDIPASGGSIVALEDATNTDSSNAKYPLSADKILRMYNWVCDNGFASFSEA